MISMPSGRYRVTTSRMTRSSLSCQLKSLTVYPRSSLTRYGVVASSMGARPAPKGRLIVRQNFPTCSRLMRSLCSRWMSLARCSKAYWRIQSTMLSAGIPLVQAFEIVGNGHENAAMQKLILSIKGDVEGGSALAEALSKHPLYFDDLFVNLVEAGEQAGALETLLDKIATYKEKTEALKKKIKKALTYPAAVLVVAFVVTTILLIFVIPAFEDLFKGFGADLPTFTRMVIDLSFFVREKGWYIAILMGGAVGTFFYFKKRSRAMRHWLDRVALKVPIIGSMPVVSRLSAAALIAGLQAPWPNIEGVSPNCRSIYSLPSTSHTSLPRPWDITKG